MKNLLKSILVLVYSIAALAPINSIAQDTISKEVYSRAIDFTYQKYHNKKVFNANVDPNWFPDSTGLWFAKFSPDQKKYLKVSLKDQVLSELFDHEKLAKILSDSLNIKADANNLPIYNTRYLSHSAIQFSANNQRYTLNLESYSITTPPNRMRIHRLGNQSPNKKWLAYTKDYNLFVKSVETDEVKQLSTDGHQGYEYATWYGWDDIMEGENGKRPDHFSVSWSEDSKWIYANIADFSTAEKMYLLDHSIDTLYRPKLLSYYRGSPGDTGMVYMEPVFFNVETGKHFKTGLPRGTHINTINATWSDTPGQVFLHSQARGFQQEGLYQFDLKTQRLDTLYSETSKTNIDNFSYHVAEKSNCIFFLSERSGWRQLYSLNLTTQEVKQVTKGNYYINEIVRYDEENQQIYFLASGKEKGRNPYFQHLYRVSFKGKNLKLLTPENKHHAISLSPDGNYFIDNFSTVNTPTSTVLRSTKSGEILAELSEAEITLPDSWTPPEIFTATARDGKTTIYGAMWKPSNFDPSKKYPVIDASYTGPHTKVFPEAFSSVLSLQSFAELGFIMIKVDGLGSPGRSKAFHDYSYKNLGGNLEDHVLAIKQLGEKYSWVDTTRVGIYGHSAGGYDAAHALLAYPEFYKVGVASSGDHDHRMEKAWWPEMYMGWPVDSAYHLQSNITMAKNLQGKLLLVHGGIDENVNPSATFKFADALVQADKQFDLLILPSQRHGYSGKYNRYFTKIRWNYFLENLQGVEPIWDIDWD